MMEDRTWLQWQQEVCPDPFAEWESGRAFWRQLHHAAKSENPEAHALVEFAAWDICGFDPGNWGESFAELEQTIKLLTGPAHEHLLGELRHGLKRIDRFVSEIEETNMATATPRSAGRKTAKTKPGNYTPPGINGTATPAAIAAHDPDAIPEDAKDISGEIIREDLRIFELVASPTNPRKHFEPAALERLATSMKDVGVLQDIVVRQLNMNPGAAARYEIIAGERRYRAAQLAGLTRVPCRIVEVSDREALEIQAVENLHREQLNPFEEAITYKQLIDAGQFTQQTLAERFKITQGQVSNRIRLLELPDVWRERMEAGQISVTQARDLVAWAKYPAVIEEIDRGWKDAWKNYVDEIGKDASGPIDNFYVRELIEDSIIKACRPMYTESWRENYRRFKPSAKQREELQIVNFGRTGDRATNVDLWDQLQKAAIERAKQTADKSEASKPDVGTCKMSAAEKKQQFEKKLYRWKIGWLQQQISDRIVTADPGLILKCVLYMAVQSESTKRVDDLNQALKTFDGKKRVDRGATRKSAWEGLSAVTLDTLPRVARAMACDWIRHTPEGYHADLHVEQIEALAGELGIDIERDWTLDRSFLELHTKDQLAALAAEWKLDVPNGKRSEIIDLLELEHPKCPQELIKINCPKGFW